MTGKTIEITMKITPKLRKIDMQLYTGRGGRRMTNEEFIAVAKAKVFENYRDRIIANFAAFPHSVKIFVTWYSKVLQNHKALLGVSDPNDHHYYEVTYNGDKKQLYLDVYDKQENKCFEVED